jgi:hypothetical protein
MMDTKGISRTRPSTKGHRLVHILRSLLTPSLLVRGANPRHDRPRRSKRQTVGGSVPERAVSHVSGVRGNKAE